MSAQLDVLACQSGAACIDVHSPYDGKVVGRVQATNIECVDEVVSRAAQGAAIARRMPRHERASVLNTAADAIERRADSFARSIALESGKPLRQARREAARCVNTLRLSAEEAKRLGGEVIPFSAFPGSERRQGYYTHEPLGIILAITPFNDPLNLAAHKLGPALAGGNAVILKPSELAPLSAQHLVECLWDAGVPRDVLQIVHGGREITEPLVRDQRIRMISFTGGPATAELITRNAGLKKLAMDLGGNAPVIVMSDCDLDEAVASCVSGAFWASGQNCIGTQRILVEESINERFTERFVALARDMKVGDPLDEMTDMGPMISTVQARRIEAWVDEAMAMGALVRCGHERSGALYLPTVLTGVPKCARVWCEEVFAPVVSIAPFTNLKGALIDANASDSSLHAGIFTRDLETALLAADTLEAGGVMINDSSDYRFDGMPFGGFKVGSLGREGAAFAVKEMTQPKVVCFKR